MRDSRRTPDGHPVRQSYRLLSHINRDKLDIFRIEKLWKNEKYVFEVLCLLPALPFQHRAEYCLGSCQATKTLPFFLREERFAFGHHYFRPHETHHSPSRRFYHNELFRVPLYEIIPLEAVVGTCCVLDLYTYCKGKWPELLKKWPHVPIPSSAVATPFSLSLIKHCPRLAVKLQRAIFFLLLARAWYSVNVFCFFLFFLDTQ